jgi:hypothetical protein
MIAVTRVDQERRIRHIHDLLPALCLVETSKVYKKLGWRHASCW